MMRFFRAWCGCTIALLLVSSFVACAPRQAEVSSAIPDARPGDAAANAGDRSLLILHTNDFHGHISASEHGAGAARIAAHIKQTRASRHDVLVLDAGDAISGTPVSTLFKGVPVFEVMSAMGYDFGLLGNHEFDHGWRHVAELRRAATFPLLGATAHGPDGTLLADAPWAIVERGDVRVAVIGVLTARTPAMIVPTGNEGLRFDEPETVLRRLVPELRRQADLVVVLSHTGHPEELELARSVPGIDVIVGGHSHTALDTPVQVGETWVVQAHEYGKAVGYLELRISGDAVELVDGGLLRAAELPDADAGVARLVARWEQQVSAKVDFRIAAARRTIYPDELKNWMEQVLRRRTGADIGYYNRGGVRDAIRRGDVTARDVWTVEPFGNTVVTMLLTGTQIHAMLQRSSDTITQRVRAEKTYRVATNSYIGDHMVQRFGPSIELRDTGVLVRDVLIDAIRDGDLPD